jgi:hypothetical protein
MNIVFLSACRWLQVCCKPAHSLFPLYAAWPVSALFNYPVSITLRVLVTNRTLWEGNLVQASVYCTVNESYI